MIHKENPPKQRRVKEKGKKKRFPQDTTANVPLICHTMVLHVSNDDSQPGPKDRDNIDPAL
jgi:hypothetical protein